MKPKLKHMKRNTQSRKDYQKNLDSVKQTKEYKKKLLKFLIFYCKANAKFYHKGILVLYDENKEKELGHLIREVWLENNTSIRRDQTGFIDNSLYLESLVDHLITEIPRIHSDDYEEYEYDLDSEEDEDTPTVCDDESNEAHEKTRKLKPEMMEEEEQATDKSTKVVKVKAKVKAIAKISAEDTVESSLEMPKKKRKVAALSR